MVSLTSTTLTLEGSEVHNALTSRLPDLADINQKLADDMGRID